MTFCPLTDASIAALNAAPPPPMMATSVAYFQISIDFTSFSGYYNG
jgi:hypothetical protein